MMASRSILATGYVIPLALIALAGSSAAATSAQQVDVQQPVRVAHDVVLSIPPSSKRPAADYYYAILVLEDYTPPEPGGPACAVSSDMRHTPYGYPHGTRRIRIVITPAPSQQNQWCPEGDYLGGVYAVPHEPPYGSTAQCFAGGVCGIVIRPGAAYSYPGGLPAPNAKGARLIERFHVRFGTS
jgi:hypothetical protein